MKTNMLRVLVFLTLSGAAELKASEDTDAAFDAPEQAHWHRQSETWFVSNLGGGISLERDGYGWITRLDKSGRVVDSRWLSGLDAPTGMDSRGGRLYVADRNRLLVISIAEASIESTVLLPEARFPNDVAVDGNGAAYVSDFTGHRIFRVADGKAEVFLDDPELRYPNGLLVDGDELLIATWGEMLDPSSFAVSQPGTLLKADLSTGSLSAYADGRPTGSMDGIVKVGEYIYATDWLAGAVLRIAADGAFTRVLSGLENPADLGYRPDTQQLMIPEMATNRVLMLHISP
ncbi:hypothetical protein [Pseudohaliea sp.]|uniref:SMP-30/gluconolactonase/LRE family protein n=1 Tax=Pseudohaliea sp. TaxID=2740289 RepID=UPI0032EE2BF7